MNVQKHHSAGQGQIATANLASVFQREIFFQVDPATLDYLDAQDIADVQPRGCYVEFDPLPFLEFLPDLEAEIFWLHYEKGKNQKDVAKLLGLSQPTVSYRYRRILDKMQYLMVLHPIDLRGMIAELPFLSEKEREVLHDLFYYTNQELVGKKHGIRQTSVKWIFVKTKSQLEKMEAQEPERWSHHLGLLVLLQRNLCIRIQ
jgi:hypothetical protein